MKQTIYVSQFRTGPEATKKQQMLFATDTAYALSEGYNFIRDSQERVFQILDENNLLEVELVEETIQEPSEVGFDPDMAAGCDEGDCGEPEEYEDEDYCLNCHNIELIDGILNNTLKQTSDITPLQADSMLKLAALQKILMGEA
jgi:hypothetical protein